MIWQWFVWHRYKAGLKLLAGPFFTLIQIFCFSDWCVWDLIIAMNFWSNFCGKVEGWNFECMWGNSGWFWVCLGDQMRNFAIWDKQNDAQEPWWKRTQPVTGALCFAAKVCLHQAFRRLAPISLCFGVWPNERSNSLFSSPSTRYLSTPVFCGALSGSLRIGFHPVNRFLSLEWILFRFKCTNEKLMGGPLVWLVSTSARGAGIKLQVLSERFFHSTFTRIYMPSDANFASFSDKKDLIWLFRFFLVTKNHRKSYLLVPWMTSFVPNMESHLRNVLGFLALSCEGWISCASIWVSTLWSWIQNSLLLPRDAAARREIESRTRESCSTSWLGKLLGTYRKFGASFTVLSIHSRVAESDKDLIFTKRYHSNQHRFEYQ